MKDADFISLRDCWASQLKAALRAAPPDHRAALRKESPLHGLVELLRATATRPGPRFYNAATKMHSFAAGFGVSLWPIGGPPDHQGASARIAAALGEVREGDAPDMGSLFARYAWEEHHAAMIDIIKRWTPEGRGEEIKRRFLEGDTQAEASLQSEAFRGSRAGDAEGWREALQLIAVEEDERSGSLDLSDLPIKEMPEQIARLKRPLRTGSSRNAVIFSVYSRRKILV